MGPRAEYVRISGNGPNALDFHIAFYIGKLATADPKGFFHVISKDTGFDPLIAYLKGRKILAGRVKSIDEIPLVKTNGAMTRDAKLECIVARLQQMKAAKPRTVKTLSSTISALFQKQLPAIVEQVSPVRVDQPVEEFQQQPRLGEVAPVRELLGISRVEGDPKEDEACVMIVPLRLGAVEPAQRAVHAQAEGLGEGVAKLALPGFEGGVVECEVQSVLPNCAAVIPNVQDS